MRRERSLRQLGDLHGRVALVTGGAGHVGAAAVHAMAELGASVAVLDLHLATCESVAEIVRAEHGVDVLSLAVDLADDAQVKAAPAAVVAKFGRLDIVVNCAALVNTDGLEGWIAPFHLQSVEAWRLAIDTNLTAAFVLAQASVDALKHSGHGSIVNIGSIYGLVGPDMRLYEGTPMGNAAAYAASKGGLLQFTRWLATVLAPDVRVNAVSPGGIWRQQPESFRQRYESRTPLGRLGSEEDLKGAVAYLASDLSAYVTGQNIVVDGGFTTW